ncbi:MAG: tetratricopeptide repeat protein, partial [Candidatus Eremiobacterota bacterium]
HCKYQKPHCVYDIIPEVFAAAIIQTIKKSSDKPRIFVQGKSLWSPSANQPVWALFDKYLNINNFDIITIDDISTNEIELAEAILLVNQLRETGLLEEALISSEEIIRKYPASPELLNLHAELKFQTGHFEEARSLFVNLADRFPHDSRILNNAGAALWNERNAEKAMDYLIKALAFDRDNRPAILNLGDILVSLNKYDDAISLFLSYMERNPYDEDIKDIMEQIKSLSGKQKYENIISEYISVVNELRQMGLIQDAYLTLSEATAQCQDSPELLNLQAEIQYQMGNIEEAKNNFLELSVRFSDHSQILNNLGVIYLQEGCPEKALEYYRKSLHVNPDDRVATLNLADLMITLNNIDEAERILSSYIERHKDDEIIRGFLDSVKEQKKEKVVVSEILEEIKEIMKDGELDLARLALKGLLCDHPDNPELLHLQDLINAQRKTSCQVKT